MPKELIDDKPSTRTIMDALLEQIYLRDVLLIINTANNEYDRTIVRKLITGEKLAAGDWDHIFGEASKVQLPDTHAAALQTIYLRFNASSSAAT